MSKMTNCKACGKEIAKGVKKCVHCGKDQRNFFMKHKIITIILAFAILGGISSTMGGNKNSTTSSTSNGKPASTTDTKKTDKTKTTDSKPKDESIKEGMYKVGSDIQAGEYVVVNDGIGYVQVSKDSSGSLESIVMNDNIQGRVYVTVKDGQYFTTKGAKTYPADKAPKVTPKDNKLPSGQYKVGVDIQAGEYKVHSDNGGYIEVSKDSTHNLQNIVSNDNFTGDKYITISNGQYITVKNGDILLSK